MPPDQPDLLALLFPLTFDGDLLVLTCQLCRRPLAYTLHAPEHAIRTDLWTHLRTTHHATAPVHAWEEG